MKRMLWALLPPVICILVGVSYRYFNEHYVTSWWVHCKYCALGEPPNFDTNDFTILLFSALCLLSTAPLFYFFKKRWSSLLIVLAINAAICAYFVKLNLWL